MPRSECSTCHAEASLILQSCTQFISVPVQDLQLQASARQASTADPETAHRICCLVEHDALVSNGPSSRILRK